MKKKILLGLLIVLNFSLISCSEEDDWEKLENKEHLVKYKLFSNTEGVPIVLEGGLIVKDYWESETITKDFYTSFSARCDDPTVLITAEIWVNDKLKASAEDNSYVKVAYRLKGDGY